MEIKERVQALAQAASAGDAGAFTQHLQAALLEKSAFKQLSAELNATSQFRAGGTGLLLFLLACVEASTSEGFVGAQPVSSLLLEVAPKAVPRSPQLAAAAAATFLHCCRAGHPRIAARLAQIYNLSTADLPPGPCHDELVPLIAQLLANGGAASTGVALLVQFPELCQHFDVAELLEDLVAGGQLATASKWAASLGREAQIQYVVNCLQYNHLKSAARAVQDWALQGEFPDVETMYKRRTLERLTGRGLWGVAATYCGEDRTLQSELVESLLLAGEACLAQEFCQLFGLDPSAFSVDEEHLAAERQRRAEAFLQLALPPGGGPHFVDSPEGLAAMALVLQEQLGLLPGGTGRGGSGGGPRSLMGSVGHSLAGSVDHGHRAAALQHGAGGNGLPAVGLDVEWKPEGVNNGNGHGAAPASILQVATDTDVFVLDLLAFASTPESLTAALGPVLGSERVYKLGVGVSSDIRKLGASYPQVAAFRLVHGCLDLGTLWKQRHVPHTVPLPHLQPGNGASEAGGKGGREVGLSTLSEALLGKPLDKSMQVSDWERRPLSESQLRYAALDAHAAVLIFRGLGQLNPAFTTHSGLETYAFSVLLPPPATHKRHWLGDDGDSWGGGGEGGGGSGAGGNDRGSGAGDVSEVEMDRGGADAADEEGEFESGSESGSGATDACWRAVHTAGGQGAEGSSKSSALGAALAGSGAGRHSVWPRQARQQQQQQQPEGAALPAQVGERLQQLGLLSAVSPMPGPSSLGGGSIDEAAAALGVPAQQVCKALAVVEVAVQGGRGAAVVCVPGGLRLSLRKALLLLPPPSRLLPPAAIRMGMVAGVMGWAKKAARLATRYECHTVFGYLPRAMPPFGYAPGISVILDQAFLPLLTEAQPHDAASQPQPQPQAQQPPQQLPLVHSDSATSSSSSSSMGSLLSGEGDPAYSPLPDSGDGDQQQPRYLFCGSGSPGSCLRLLPQQLQLLVPDAIVADVCTRPQGPLPAMGARPAGVGSAAALQGPPALRGGPGSGDPGAPRQLGHRFLLDTMCSRLCRWLRCLGIDAEFIGGEHPRHRVAALAARASAQGRVVLTRDRRLHESPGAGAVLLLHSDDTEEQLGELVRHFGIRFDEAAAMSRCSKCNAAAFELLDKEQARPHVPQHVFNLVDEFFRCGRCGKVFWVGPKSLSAMELVTGVLTRLGATSGATEGPVEPCSSGSAKLDSSLWERQQERRGAEAVAAQAAATAAAAVPVEQQEAGLGPPGRQQQPRALALAPFGTVIP